MMFETAELHEKMQRLRRRASSLLMVALMATMTLATAATGVVADLGSQAQATNEAAAGEQTPLGQSTGQAGNVPTRDQLSPAGQAGSDVWDNYDLTWSDPLAMIGKATDPSMMYAGGVSLLLEENIRDDHDNDGINDLDDFDDDNDGVLDLIELFDGCYGTHPYDHDNDGVLDHLDWDDDNDGILEGPIDWNRGTGDPLNVTSDRYVISTTVHPWTGTTVGSSYQVDQLPFDHDNDGVPDEDTDGSGAGRYDEDDDNDGRIDQFEWQCDFDGDGVKDWFDNDDDGDGVSDVSDTHPYNASITTMMSATAALYDAPSVWTAGQYSAYSGGVDFVAVEGARLPNWPAFTSIQDGDLDGDGIPNFLDPDGDNDLSPNNVDTDDDNDGLLDMWDPDDDNDGIADVDEIDYDKDADNDRWRAFDQNYNGIWDWFDPDMGGSAQPDNPNGLPAINPADFPWDIDNDLIENENDSYPTTPTATVNSWNCGTVNEDPQCLSQRMSYPGFNDWDGDGISNWDDVDDDGDGIIDALDIDWDCDLDNDNDLHIANGSKYRDDGPNDLDIDIDGDGLPNDIDWDDDNDGIADYLDPDDGNCGVVDYDQSDNFAKPYYPFGDGENINGTGDSQRYGDNTTDWWRMTYLTNPFDTIIIPYNGYNAQTNPVTSGIVPEMYWYLYARWSPWSGGNDVDIDNDGDALQNGLDVDQDGDGMPDWWDEDEGNDGIMDVDDWNLGGSINNSVCGMSFDQGFICGYLYALSYGLPLNGQQVTSAKPYSTRPDPSFSQGSFTNPNGVTESWHSCASNCYVFQFAGAGVSAVNYSVMQNNRDAYMSWFATTIGAWNWLSDTGAMVDLPDELGFDFLKNDVDFDSDGDFGANDTADLDDDWDGIFNHWDVDDDNDGIIDWREIDSDDDWDNDAGTNPPGNFFTGTNCQDNDDDGTDTDPDEDGFYQSVWDRGRMGQGLLFPLYYDVDNDNDGIPDPEDDDDDNNGILDSVQEQIAGCFWGEEQAPWDHDNDGIVNWEDDDWDADGRTNAAEIAAAPNGTFPVAPWDHDNDGLRDDLDLDDDADGMEDHDEVLLWPLRFDRNSTNPWDHDDFGFGEGIANPNDDSTGPDAYDQDDDNDSRDDADFDVLEEGFTSDACYNGSQSSDWDHDNDCVPDEDDKLPTRITMTPPNILWLDAREPALFSGHVEMLNLTTGNFTNGANLPVQVIIEWTLNGTVAIESIDVVTDRFGRFTVGQFLYPEAIHVGDNTTYEVYAVVTEMFAFDGSESQRYPVGVEANLTIDYFAWNYFRSDEQPFWVDFKVHYAADWDRGLYDTPIEGAPVLFNISGGPFGNRTHPTTYAGIGGAGYRTDNNGWASLTWDQASNLWYQLRFNSTLSNGPGKLPGGYEQIVYNNGTLEHDVIGRYNYTNTSLPKGDYDIVGSVLPSLAPEWPWPFTHPDETDAFSIRAMQRMQLDTDMIVDGVNPVYFWDRNVITGSGVGAWRALFHEQALTLAGLDYATISSGYPYPMQWDGNPASLVGTAAEPLESFLTANATHWFIAMLNGADFDVPPCGPIQPLDPDSPVRCEIIPQMNTGDSLEVKGTVANRTGTPWTDDPITLQVDLDHNGEFAGSQETAYARRPILSNGAARFDYDWTWYNQYQAGTYGMRVDFVQSEYYFTGNLTSVLSATGSFINVTVFGYTDFALNTVPRLYRAQSTSVEARLIDNALQPVRETDVQWHWTGDDSTGTVTTDSNGIFLLDFDIPPEHPLGPFNLTFTYGGSTLLEGTTVTEEFWVVSRTFLRVIQTSDNERYNGDIWGFTAQVTDDNKTPDVRDTGQSLDGGPDQEDGGTIEVIFEGTDSLGVRHRQKVAELEPNAGQINREFDLDPRDLRDDPFSYLPDGFGPVNVYLRYVENLPHEGCAPINQTHLELQGRWDPCGDITGSDHFRRELTYTGGGFALIGRVNMTVDDQIVYTSDIDPLTGEAFEKPMVVTGSLQDELGNNLIGRSIRVVYDLQSSGQGPVACPIGVTDEEGRYAIECNLGGAAAGLVRVSVEYNAWSAGDAYRYENKTTTVVFPVFSNSTLALTDIGPFLTGQDQYPVNGQNIPVFYLKESFHVGANLSQVNGRPLGGKCLNIYLDPANNTRPLASDFTDDESGTIFWYSADPVKNPTQQGVGPSGGRLEGFRILRVAYEPDREVPGGCDREFNALVNGSADELLVLVRSRVELQVKDIWARESTNGYRAGETVEGSVAVIRDRLDVAVEGEIVEFHPQYWDNDLNAWVTYWSDLNSSTTNEQGVARFGWVHRGDDCGDGVDCSGEWRVVAYFPGSLMFASSDSNITGEVPIFSGAVRQQSSSVLQNPAFQLTIVIIGIMLLIAGAITYRRLTERAKIEVLRGILTDTMLQLQAANEYIAVIFNCYRELVGQFRKRGFIKKVYETNREFELAVRKAFWMVPAEQLDALLSVFEEARYSDHQIGAEHRDRAIETLQAITVSVDQALGTEALLQRTEEHAGEVHAKNAKAGEFVTADGSVMVAGKEDGAAADGFKV